MDFSRPEKFRAVSYPLRLYSGPEALAELAPEVRRNQAARAFVICGQTVAHRTDLLSRIAVGLGPLYAGVYDRMDKDSSYTRVVEAAAMAREAGADLLIAVGGGSVIVGTRVVAILLAEKGDPFQLMTQYPEGRPAVSPRLMAPKMPIINVPTTPTSAMNRGGSALRNDDLDHRMEFFDPKTRPAAIFWDSSALLSAPLWLARSTATTTYTGALQAVTASSANPLAEGDNLQAFGLASRGLPGLIAEPENPTPRIELCAAALLQNRSADDGFTRGGGGRTWNTGYALATALHIRFDYVGQGEATSSVMPSLIRRMGTGLETALRLVEALRPGRSATADNAAPIAAEALAEFYKSIGMPARVRELGIPESALPLVARDTLKNFKANPGERSANYEDEMLAALRACW